MCTAGSVEGGLHDVRRNRLPLKLALRLTVPPLDAPPAAGFRRVLLPNTPTSSQPQKETHERRQRCAGNGERSDLFYRQAVEYHFPKLVHRFQVYHHCFHECRRRHRHSGDAATTNTNDEDDDEDEDHIYRNDNNIAVPVAGPELHENGGYRESISSGMRLPWKAPS